MLRLGNSTDALESAKRAVHLSDVVLRFCITVSHLNRALYFACDNVLWAGKSGLAPRVDQEKWAQRSFRLVFLLSYKTMCSLHSAKLAKLASLVIVNILLYTYGYFACMPVYHLCAWCWQRPKEGIRIVVLDGCELSCGLWESKPRSQGRAASAFNH